MSATDRGRTYYSDEGEGAPLVFVHALGLNTNMWGLQVPVLTQRYRVVRYDVRGHGLTPYSGEPISIASLADDLLELMDHLELERAVVVGISMGGMIAQAFAIAHPERVFALGLVSTVPTFPDGAREGLRERADSVERDGMEPMVAPAITRWFTEGFRARALADPLPESTGTSQTLATTGSNFEARAITAISGMIRAADPMGYAAICRALADTDLTAGLETIACPALVMSGEHDPGVGSQSQETLIAGIGESIQVIVPNSSHLVPIECATEFNEHLMNFLAWCGY